MPMDEAVRQKQLLDDAEALRQKQQYANPPRINPKTGEMLPDELTPAEQKELFNMQAVTGVAPAPAAPVLGLGDQLAEIAQPGEQMVAALPALAPLSDGGFLSPQQLMAKGMTLMPDYFSPPKPLDYTKLTIV